MDLLLDGHLQYQACTEGKGGGLKACWKQLVSKYGDLEVRIFKQDHAKVVLGAKEYKRQERALGKKKTKSTETPSPTSKPKKKPASEPKPVSTKQQAKTASKEKPRAKDISSDEKPQQQVNIEAAKASQAKLDAFLTNLLG
jgi:hypothetical protein